ncbi:MAG: CRISPR-associated endoribonuclease Cas6 [Anaerolineaceae bacterium]|jgi:CRISPR-associated endoribonuclease Cas6
MTPDLVSLVIKLRNPRPASMAADQGRAMAAEFLRWVRIIQPELSAALHDKTDVPKPYTVSNLNGLSLADRGTVLLPENSEVWFRITSLSPEISLFMVDKLLQTLPVEIQVGDATFKVEEAIWEAKKHPWAGWINYSELIEKELMGEVSRIIRMEFISPTTFHTRGVHMPYVLPALALRSWLKTWNAFAPIKFSESLLETAESALAVSYYKMQSIAVRYGKATLVGGVGDCTFNIQEKDPYWLHVIKVLSAFAFYAGTGAKTALGLGQTRRVNQSHAYRK